MSTEIHERIGQARRTGLLDLSDQYNLGKIPDEVFTLSNLRELNLSGNALAELSPAIQNLSNLQVLNLNGHRLQDLPDALFGLTSLEVLNLEGGEAPLGLRYVPSKIGQLSHLKELNLSFNALTDLPSAIGQLNQLEKLYLTNNQLRDLPEEIVTLVSLKQLFLGNNKLEMLPPSVTKLAAVEGLYCENNKIGQLSDSLVNLKKLKIINLRNNQLRELPLSLRHLHSLTYLDLRGNPLPEKEYPAAIINDGFNSPAAILEELEILHESTESELLAEAKVILLGDGGVGKTSLVNRLVHNEFNSDESTTKGVTITAWEITNEVPIVRLNVWDFAGQAIMHATHQLFLTKKCIYLIVLNARQEQQNDRLVYWLNTVTSFVGKEAAIIVVINGIDENHLLLDQSNLSNKYPIREFVETSARTGIGLDDLKRKILETAQRELPAFHTTVPLSWKKLCRLIEARLRRAQLNGRPLEKMLERDFREMCQRRKIVHEKDQARLLNLMHEIGVVFSPQIKRGKQVVSQASHCQDENAQRFLLDPNQLIKDIYDVLSSRETLMAQQNDGRISPSELENILNSITMERHHWQRLKALMLQFDLCLELNGKEIIFTRLLPITEPAISLPMYRHKTEFTYCYNFLPESIFSRLLGTFLRNFSFETFEIEAVWQKGAYLVINDLNFHLLFDSAQERVDLTIWGDDLAAEKQLLERLRLLMGQVHDQIPGLTVKQMVPLRGTHIDGDALLIPYDTLIELQTMGEEYYADPQGGLERRKIKELLDPVETKQLSLPKLKELLEGAFNINELKTLCFELDVDHEYLEGRGTKDGFARALILHLKRRSRLEDLISLCIEKRPERFESFF